MPQCWQPMVGDIRRQTAFLPRALAAHLRGLINATDTMLAHPARTRAFPVHDYDLDATLASGQVFGWRRRAEAWIGVVRGRWVALRQSGGQLIAETVEPQPDWSWLTDYLQLSVNLEVILNTFPQDPLMLEAMADCRGLRLLRQDPWECLAGFILSSTKQIVQIEQIITALRTRFGAPVPVAPGERPAFTFPSATQLAANNEAELRACKMGFRAPNLRATAQQIANGSCRLAELRAMPIEHARAELLKLPGVGPKIADCVLLFAYGFPTAFPVDVWVARTLRRHYPRTRRMSLPQLREFGQAYFGPNAGYAQQYLFHHIRRQAGKLLPGTRPKP